MDPELLLIFTFVILITLVSFGFGSIIHKRQLAYKERKEAYEREQNRQIAGAKPEEFAKLEERVRVLERIATDKDVSLAQQIEALRDVQEIEQLTAPKEATR